MLKENASPTKNNSDAMDEASSSTTTPKAAKPKHSKSASKAKLNAAIIGKVPKVTGNVSIFSSVIKPAKFNFTLSD